MHCCSERPRMLLPFLQHADKHARQVIGRVLGEIATPALGTDLLQFVEDEQPELRAAAARALSCAGPSLAVDVLAQLARDSIWFVRLRAVVSLGKLSHASTVAALLHSIRDPNRLVRLRAAEALLDVNADRVNVFEQVVAAGDRYALHAFLTALDNAGLVSTLQEQIRNRSQISQARISVLLQVLQSGSLPAEILSAERALARAASQP
jgi:HEAT repeat protein